MNIHSNELIKKQIYSQPATRKSRSISRYFLGNKRSSIDNIHHNDDIHRCLISIGIFDSYELYTNVTIFHDDTACRRLLILTNKNQLIIGKYFSRQIHFKLKYRIDLTEIWLKKIIHEQIVPEITSLTYYDSQRSFIIGWPLSNNYLFEFETAIQCHLWYEYIQSKLFNHWQINDNHIEHVRIVIDQNYSQFNQMNNSTSFLIRKMISIRPDETVRDLIKKSIDAFHLRDPLVDNYVLFVKINGINTNTQSTHLPLIGHEHPYSIKMKHLKLVNNSMINNRSFDNDEHLFMQNQCHSSSTSLNHVSTSNYHDFQLQKREKSIDNPTKKHRFFNKRKTKVYHNTIDDNYSSSTISYLNSPISNQMFGQHLDDLIQRSNQQLPSIIIQLLEILYWKGPDTIGIFRKVANARLVKECIDKIERNISLNNDDLHPILAACLFKHFLRTLPEPIFHSIQYDNWKKCLRLITLNEKILFARTIILSNLSHANHLVLKGFICILHRISEKCQFNGMNPFNLGLCVSNNLFKTESTCLTSGKQEADVMSSIVEFLIHNCSVLFGSDILTCISDKRILVHQLEHYPHRIASSFESLDEVESSSPNLLNINRSHDSGLAASDQPFNDDSSELSEQSRQANQSTIIIKWFEYVSYGIGPVINTIHPIKPTSISRRRNSKLMYKPSKQFLEREKFTNNTTDDSDDENNRTNNSNSIRSSTTTIQNITIGKMKRSKSLSRHSSLGSNEPKIISNKQTNKDYRYLHLNDDQRTTSLKQIDCSSNEIDDDQKQNLDLITQSITTPRSQRTFVHYDNSRPFILTEAIQMKPIENVDKRRPCHRQNALRYKTTEHERQARISTPAILINNTSRYQSIERRIPISNRHFDDRSWSVKEKTRFFEHTLTTGRENYV